MSKSLLFVIRVAVGLLFIFSGLIKANDPLGLSYKMQEFFEAWNLKGLHAYTLAFAFIMNVLEVVAGVALIVGWQLKRFIWLLLGLIVFFTFLTAYVLFSGKIHACGCFGDCVPLTPVQTFTKDIILLLLSFILLFNIKKLTVINIKNGLAIVVLSLILTTALQVYVLNYLPIVDCLPYAKGKSILQGMQLPKNATPDEYAMIFKYKKDGKMVEFKDSIPDEVTEDTTYVFIDREDKLIKKGTGLPAITDFKLVNANGTDTTEALLKSGNKYLLIMVKDFDNVNKWKNENLGLLYDEAAKKNIPIFIVTPNKEQAIKYFDEHKILLVDATVLKTAARVNPTYIFMKGDVVENKLSFRSKDALLKAMQLF